eukprot:2806780-Pleurochrysis_carterae.AAC.4
MDIGAGLVVVHTTRKLAISNERVRFTFKKRVLDNWTESMKEIILVEKVIRTILNIVSVVGK